MSMKVTKEQFVGMSYDELLAENAKLRERIERLVTLLRNDCDIDASWDGLRRFWTIGLTEGGCLMRDRACKAEAENAKLRELVRDYEHCTMHADCSKCEYDGKMSTHCQLSPCFPDADELRELGVDDG